MKTAARITEMKIRETKLAGCFILEHDTFFDNRGSFLESYNKRKFERLTNHTVEFVQDNLSFSKKGVLRGLHFQRAPYEQAKLIQVVRGEVIDVIVDLRKESETLGQHIRLKMSSENPKCVFIPKGMAHGFLALSDEVCFQYKCDEFYNPIAESGIAHDDEELKIDWGYPKDKIILSEKDKDLPSFKSYLK